jgi:hypothetical protein
LFDLAHMRPEVSSSLVPIDDEDAPVVQRFLNESDCTWLEDPEDPRYGTFHEAQWNAVQRICAGIGVEDAEREFLLLTGRQAAKTTTLLLAYIKTATERPGSRSLYVSFDLATGQELIYEPAQAWLDKLGWKYRATSNGPSGLRIRLENGSVIQCRSADDLRAAGKLRGRGWHLIGGDELQDMLHVAEKLFSTVLGPTQLRHRGAMVLAFTPPDVCAGWLWKEYESGRWTRLGWSMTANPFLPPGEVERLLKQRGLTLDHPIARREIKGLWEPNSEKQVYEFSYQLNTYDHGGMAETVPAKLPEGKEFPADKWVYGLGGDIGWVHDSAVVFLAWNLNDPQKRIYEVLTLKGPGWTFDKWFEVLMDFRLHIKKRPFRSAIMDQAGAGSMNIIHSLEERFRQSGLPITLNYKPSNVPATVAMTNDSFRIGRLLLRQDSPLLEEIPNTVWKDGTNRGEIDKAQFDPHGLDALRYAVWGATNYKAKAVPDPVTLDPEAALAAEVDAQIGAFVKSQKKERGRRRLPGQPF